MTAMREGVSRLRHYETGADDHTVWGLGLGCNGSVDIFVQPFTSADALDLARRVRTLLAGDAPFAVSTIVRGPSTALGRMLVAGDGAAAGATGDPALDHAIARRAQALLAAGESQFHDVESTGVFTEVHVPAATAPDLRRRRRRDSPCDLCSAGRLPGDRRRSPSRLPVP